MKKKLLLFVILTQLVSCTGESSDKTKETDKKNNPYEFGEHRVGLITNGTTVDDLYSLYGDDRIKKVSTVDPATNKTTDNYYILDENKHVVMVATPRENKLNTSRINHISLKSNRFKSDKGIGMNSTTEEVETAYPAFEFLPSADNIVMYIPELDANLTLNKKTLGNKEWWDADAGVIIADSISGKATISAIDIYWEKYEGNILTGGFWRDLTNRLVAWTIKEVPSIIILSLIFFGLMRLLILIVNRTKKIVMKRASRDADTDILETEKRVNTLSGIMFGIGKIVLWVIFLLILLGKFNINIAPILASAGIVGLAVGFGAQELVRDFISGFFILLEDQLRAGDWAIINGTSGLVEKIELRTITLRDGSGVVHIFQNGKINSLSNMTKEWSAVVLDIGVAYKENTDLVVEVMKEVGETMMKDGPFADKILEPVEVLGVDNFGDSAVIIKVKIKTKPIQQWAVGREYRRLLKKAFDEKNIEMPFPHVSLYWGEASKDFKIKIDRD